MTHLFKLQITDIQSIDDEMEDLSDRDLTKVIGGVIESSSLPSSSLSTSTLSNSINTYPTLLAQPEEGYRSQIVDPVGNRFPDLLNIIPRRNISSTPSIAPLSSVSSPLPSIVPTSLSPASSSPMFKASSFLK